MPSFYCLDVRHGNSNLLIDTKGVLVVDTGPGADLLTFLLKQNINKIDILLISHADKDHIGGAISLLMAEEIQINQVYLNSDASKGSAVWDDMVYALYDQHKHGGLKFEPSLTPNLNGKLSVGEVIIEVLAPNQYIVSKGCGNTDRHGRKLTSNSISAVIRLSHNGKLVALLPGDLDNVGLENLLEDHAKIPSWLLVFPHHGGKPGDSDIASFTTRFCEVVKPEVIVFSIKENVKDFPQQEVISTISSTLASVCMYTTRSSDALQSHIKETGTTSHKNAVGSIKVDLNKDSLSVAFIS